MRRIFFAPLLLMALAGYAQVKPSMIGFSANLVDFSASVPKIGKVDPGYSIMYWKGIGKKIDFSLRYNGLFTDYTKGVEGSNDYSNEFEASLHVRPINDNHLFSPFLSAGIGVGNYGSRWATYTPLGGGLQLNMSGEGYIFLQANYRISLQSANLDNNMFYSLGFTQPFASHKAAPVVRQIPLPPPPVVEAVPEVKDRDKDGVPDSLDACPDVAGLPQFNGCPDTDGDGIPDKDDKCPNTPGVAKYQGCPIPDRDGDGVNDEEDRCPDIAGDVSNHGCPIVKEEVKKRADFAAQHIYFATASFVLLKKSFTGLDEIAGLMTNDPGLKLYVDGYTDNTGLQEKNQVLSEKRAASVKQYLTRKGITEDRILSAGHGPADPVADNKTAAGRARNRRVVLKLDYQ